MSLDIFSLIVLLGATQGLVFGLYLLFSRSDNKRQKNALAGLMFILAHNGFETFNWSAKVYLLFFNFFPFVLIFGLGPCMYLYVNSFTEKGRAQPARVHFRLLWALFSFRVALVIYDILFKHGIKAGVHPNDIDAWYATIAEPLSVLVFLTYLYFSWKTFKRDAAAGVYVSPPGTKKWLRAFMICMLALGIIWPLTVAAPYLLNIPWDSQYYPVEVLMVFFIYWIAMAGYQRTRVVYVAPQKPATAAFIDSLPPAEIDACATALQKAMDADRLYMDPELDVNALAAHVKASPKTVSAVLNRRLNKGFNEFINEYRIQAVKEKMTDPANKHLTISGMAFECGFNSQATFQRAFKNMTGVTPKEFLSGAAQNQEK